jgi:hypothetical protein
VIHLVAGSGYLVHVDERQLLGICKASYGDDELLCVVVQREKERRNKMWLCQKNFRPSSRNTPNPRTLLSYACEKEDYNRIKLLISLGASTCFYCLPRAIECNRFEIVELLLAYDPTAKSYLINGGLSSRAIVECRENIVKFAGLPGVTASDKVELGLTYNFPQLITDNLYEGTQHLDWIGWNEGYDWPVERYRPAVIYDDPLHLREAGWVWIGVSDDDFEESFFQDLVLYGDHESEALQALSSHPVFSPTDRMILAGKVKDAAWVEELIDSNQYNSPDEALSNDEILYGASCAGLTHVAVEMLELGASANATGYFSENRAIHQAAWNENEELVRTLYNHGCFEVAALLAACYLGLTDIVAELLDLNMDGVDANSNNDNLGMSSFLHGDSEAETPILIACARGHTQLMRYLFQQGAGFDEITALRLVYWGEVEPKVGVEVMRVLVEFVDPWILRHQRLYADDDEESRLLMEEQEVRMWW